MTRIVLDPGELAAAARHTAAAGEYQAIGARVASCDCGCMPADVAATVDGATSSIRSRLDSLSAGLATSGADLAWRSGVPQDGATVATAASAASGPGVDPNVITIGGTASDFGLASSSMSLMIGGSVVGGNGGAGSLVIGGNDPFASILGGSNSTMTIGGSDPLAAFFAINGRSDGSVVIGGVTPYTSTFGGPTMSDALMSLGYSIQARQDAMRQQLANMPSVRLSATDPVMSMITNQLWKNMWDSQRRLDVVMSPNYHSSSYFSSYSDFLSQFPSDIRYR